MKKVLLGIVYGAAVVVGFLLIWKCVLPLIGSIFNGFGDVFIGFGDFFAGCLEKFQVVLH